MKLAALRIVSGLVGLAILGTPATVTTTRTDCHVITDGTDAEWARLIDEGFHGVTVDGMEALYAPSC